MKSKKIFWVVLALALVLGIAACGDDNGNGGNTGNTGSGTTNTSLNGTWVRSESGQTDKVVFTNGSYTTYYNNKLQEKGTYTTSGSNLTITCTHISGERVTQQGGTGNAGQWYTRTEAAAAGVSSDRLNNAFTPFTATYVISGNNLSFTMGGSTTVYTKQ